MSPLLRLSTLLALCTCSLIAMAQQGTVASGGDATGSGGSVSHSTGQAVWTTADGQGGTVQQGVQQPYLVIPTSLQPGPDGKLLLTAYPNPSSDELSIHANTVLSPLAEALLYTAEGRLVLRKVLDGTDTTLDLKALAAGTYHLAVQDGERPLGKFNVIKR
jgi:hypothetical protein